MSTWRGSDIAKAFGISDEGMVLNGVFCLNTPLGLATPSVYRGDLDFLQWLGAQLPQINTQLGRLSLSRLLKAPSGQFYAKIGQETVILSTLETGPSCDPRNAFELFTVAAGLAHVHQQRVEVGGTAPDWLKYYQAQRDKLAQLAPPNLPKRASAAWANLEEVWRLCAEEAINLLKKLKDLPRASCLALGLQSFSDFVYLADRHQVHYNLVAKCHLDSPAVDMARLVSAAGSETRIAHNMILSYQRVRKLTDEECREFFAHLWFPHEVELEVFSDVSVNPLRLQRARTVLQEKIGMISELEDILLPPADEVDGQREKEVVTVNEKKVTPAQMDEPELQLEPVLEEPVAEPEVEMEVSPEPIVDNDKPQEVEQDEVRINMTATTPKRTTVWGPFPAPLNKAEATTEPEPAALQEREEETSP
ncbi:MAG TPA: hypothetical protein GX738_01230 [Firmicutes bacterium]|jgi:hypothetical protein|nr:hypothetical protein [Bacillota bacterium]